MSDEELIEDFLSGDKSAFELLFNRYHRDLFYLIKSFVKNNEETKDITQDTFIKAFNNLRGLKDRTKFKAWLFKIGINMAKDRIKTRRNYQSNELDFIRDNNDLEKYVIEDNITKVLNNAIQNLPERQGDILRLRVIDEMSFKEIADILDIKETSVRTNFHFAIKNLRQFIFGKEKKR